MGREARTGWSAVVGIAATIVIGVSAATTSWVTPLPMVTILPVALIAAIALYNIGQRA